jgi:cytochrome c553
MPSTHVFSAMLPCLFMTTLLAATPPASPQPPRPARLGLCAACHGADGHATVPGAPNLAGQNLDYLLSAMQQYRDGGRDNAVMRAALGPLGETELQQLAYWYAAQPPRAGVTP